MKSRLGVIQNLSLLDRILRGVLTAVLLATPVVYIATNNAPYQLWNGIFWLLSVYFGLTALLGWDPLYHLVGAKSCKTGACGTLPYQVDAAMGHHPEPKSGFDHSLGGSRHPNPKGR
ncbi:MAG: DUF2892 domain-containing protein [Chromatiales bacterium]|jgi:hypothetical protein|nr:DUF2892 domain-containing protein [Chromatiales bacterium]